MNILHYSLGFPPFRRGGMTQYCMDLMQAQVKAGHTVALLWPGKLYNLTEKSKIEKRGSYHFQSGLSCGNYELVNPLPIPLMDGLQNPGMYLIHKEKKAYVEFFRMHRFQIVHLHTFMGLPAELLEAAQEAGMKIVFTTHDYFPVCPRCNLFNTGKDCLNDHDCADCTTCNQHGLSFNKMKFFQSGLYKTVKENFIVKALRARHNRKLYDIAEQAAEEKIVDESRRKNYQALRRRNIELLERMDIVHCNSTNTLQVYRGRGYSGCNAQVISISNGAISDHKKLRKVGNPLRFGYLGPLTTHKGYNLFRNACDALWQSGQHCFEAHIFVETDNLPSYMVCHKPYSYNELPAVMDSFDVLVIPSEWEETFGFTVLEALSYGIPAIVSNKVGAKDLIVEGRNGFVVDGTVQAVENCLRELVENPETVQRMNSYIVNNFDVKTMTVHSNEIETVYRKICHEL